MEGVCSLYELTKVFIVRKLLHSPKEINYENDLHRCFSDAETKLRDMLSDIFPKKLSSDMWIKLRLMRQAYLDTLHWFKVYKKDILIFLKKRLALNFSNDSQFNLNSFLTPIGEFDDMKWVQKFVDDEQNPILDRFRFACFYCLESEIRFLWQIISHMDVNVATDDFHLFDHGLVRFWVDFIEGRNQSEFGEIPSTTACVLIYSSKLGYEKAVFYLWNRLSAEDRNYINNQTCYLIRFSELGDHFKITEFLYSQLTIQQQLHVLQSELASQKIRTIWKSYLDSSFYQKIPEQITRHQNFLPATCFSQVLCRIMKKIFRNINPYGNGVCNFEKLFCEVWSVGSPTVKNYVLQEKFDILSDLFFMQKYSCIKMLLKDSTFENKRSFLCSKIGSNLFGPLEFEFNDVNLNENYLFSLFHSNNVNLVKKDFFLFLVDLNKEHSDICLKPFYDYSLDLIDQIQKDSFLSAKIKTAPLNSDLITFFNNIRDEIVLTNLLNEMLNSL